MRFSKKSTLSWLTILSLAIFSNEVNDGFGWASWRNRTDKILETFFPLAKTMK